MPAETPDYDAMLDRIASLLDRLERLLQQSEEVEAHKLNMAYQQGAADERKARTGLDPKVKRMA